MAEVPFPLADPQEIVDAVTRRFSACTRLLLVDHITSPTGILFPIKELVQAAHDRGIRVLVDGAHAPGSIDVRIRELGCDYYTANHHKWLCGPKVSGFLYVRPEHQHEVLPTVISHAANRPRPHRSQFLASFDWTGTYDPCPLLALPTALDFLSQLRPGGWAEHLASNRALAFAARDAMACVLGVVPPAPTRMLATLVTLPLPMTLEPRQVVELQQRLFREARVELPLYNWPEQGPSWLRVSAQAYNDLAQYEYCARAIQQYL